MSAVPDFKSLLEKFIHSIPAANAGLCFLYNNTIDFLFVKSAVGFSKSIVSQIRIKPGESIIGKTFQTKKVRIYRSSDEIIREMASMTSKNRYFFIDGREEWSSPYSVISFPLIDAENQCFGIINLYSFKSSAYFDVSDSTLMKTITDQVLSLENFVFTLDTEDITDEPLRFEQETDEKIEFTKPFRKILVVDDELPILIMLQDFLELKGYDVVTANSGMKAISLLEKETFHLVLLDIKMPKMDGIEVLRRIKEMDENISIIMTTGLKDKEMNDTILELGANDCVIKPFDFDYLERAIAVQFFNTSV